MLVLLRELLEASFLAALNQTGPFLWLLLQKKLNNNVQLTIFDDI